MYNKQSCWECGASLVPHSLCSACKEHNSWVCKQCGGIKDYIHVKCRQELVIAKG